MPDCTREQDGLITAVYRGDIDSVRAFVEGSQSLEFSDSDRRTSLFHAVLAENADPEIVRLLTEAGADVNARDREQSWSPLHHAAQSGRVEIARVLVEAGAEIDARDGFGNSPLWRAVMSSKGRGEMIKFLLNHGADRNLANNSGVSPLALAKRIANYDIEQHFLNEKEG